jgi:hypothetical protein
MHPSHGDPSVEVLRRAHGAREECRVKHLKRCAGSRNADTGDFAHITRRAVKRQSPERLPQIRF